MASWALVGQVVRPMAGPEPGWLVEALEPDWVWPEQPAADSLPEVEPVPDSPELLEPDWPERQAQPKRQVLDSPEVRREWLVVQSQQVPDSPEVRRVPAQRAVSVPVQPLLAGFQALRWA